jgi:hypothetical protein
MQTLGETKRGYRQSVAHFATDSAVFSFVKSLTKDYFPPRAGRKVPLLSLPPSPGFFDRRQAMRTTASHFLAFVVAASISSLMLGAAIA